jgi:protein-arginine kinase
MRLTVGTGLAESVTGHISALKIRKRQAQVLGREHRIIVCNPGIHRSRQDEAD